MLTICNFHYIRTDFDAPFPSIFGVTPYEFENQLMLLGKMGEFINQTRLIDETDAILSSESNFILITFDDGLQEQFLLAKPILDKLNIEAIYYINSINYIDKKVSLVHKIHLLRSQFAVSALLKEIDLVLPEHRFSLTEVEKAKAVVHYHYDEHESAYLKYFLNFKLSAAQTAKVINALFSANFNEDQIVADLYMTTAQLKELSGLNMLGNHTHSHFILGLLSPEEIHEEIGKTKKFIEDFGYNNKHSMSYPYGSKEAYNEPVTSIAKMQGYDIGLTTDRGVNDISSNQLLLKRFDCIDLPGGKIINKTVLNK